MKKDSQYYLSHADNLGWGSQAKLDQERVELLNKYLVGKKILDVGCGTGVYVEHLTKLGFEAWGVDMVKEFVKYKNQKGQYKTGLAEKLPFEDQSFDTVLAFDILEHGDDKVILKELVRVARQRIIIIVPKIVDQRLAESGVIFRHYLDKSHLREYNQNDLKRLADQFKLKVILVKEIHNLFNETIFSALFGGSPLFKKIVRKLVLLSLPKIKYPTELVAVFDS